MEREMAARIIDELAVLYPDAGPELNFSNPYETLVATILSAQCTDRRVNMVTEKLFKDYPDVYAMAELTPDELEPKIKECGLYHAKAKNICAACRKIIEEHGGQVPRERAALEKLPGVGRKTAGVVLMAAYGVQQIPVDTHVFRVSRRIGLASAHTPEGVERELQSIIDESRWTHTHHLLIFHGRRICHARGPKCTACPLKEGLCQGNIE